MNEQSYKHKEELLRLKEAECNKLYRQLCDMRRTHLIRISDHAILRYMERHYKMDLNKVEDEIITKQVEEMYSKLGDGTYPTGNGSTRVVIKNGTVVTVIN